MGKITFIIGGARSGKSRYALSLAKKEKTKRVAFIATCQPFDEEMRKRIKLHRKKRPAGWQTFEEPYKLSSLLRKNSGRFDMILIDCITLLISNLFLRNLSEGAIMKEIGKLLAALKKNKGKAIIVSNELGLGIVPENELARSFRDVAGMVNQLIAKESDSVFFMTAGLPLRIK